MGGGDIESIALQEEKKSLDKKEIEVEEREKMLNEENKPTEEIQKQESDVTEIIKPSGEPVSGEGREVKPKFIPIGGIKMPGFFTRTKPREKCKDGDDGAQGELLEKTADDGNTTKESADEKDISSKKYKLPFKISNPFSSWQRPTTSDDAAKDQGTSNTEGTTNVQKKSLLSSIRLPLANMIPKRLRGHGESVDAEAGLDATKQAELASMETLDDNKDASDKIDTKTDDGMETVKLDVEDKTDAENANKEKLHWRERIRQQKFIIDDLVIAGGVLLFIILLIILIAVTMSGKETITSSPLKNGRYIDAVTSCGLVEGVLEDDAFVFRGIPYAQPPVENNRWKTAKQLNRIESCWNGTLKAHNATPPCIQIYGNGSVDGVEDCLTLDVITPYVQYDNPLPVVVLIGSETLIGGSPGNMVPHIRRTLRQEVVLVRPNFRLGALGFLSLRVLSNATYPQRSGNFGLSDIIAALNWIQLNIKNFAGDPKAVTLFGHQAGATLVTSLLSYKHSKKLFARAWVSSGSALYPGKSVEEIEKENEPYLGLVKCEDITCLRSLDPSNVINSVPDTWRNSLPDLPLVNEITNTHEWLVDDGVIINGNIANAIATSEIPIVIGTTAHGSASDKLFMKHTSWTPELVRQHINNSKIGSLNLTDKALNIYNATYQGLAAMISDIRVICPLLTLSRRDPPIPFYIVTQGRGDDSIADVDIDVSAILGNYEPQIPEQQQYVTKIRTFFYDFVRKGIIPWATAKNPILMLNNEILPMREYPNCDLWFEHNISPLYGRQD